MSGLPQNKQDVAQFFSQEQFVIDTCQQINKDLAGLSAYTPNFDIDMNADVLEQVVSSLQDSLKQMNSSSIQQFIYRVDLKESDFHKALSGDDNYFHLAFMVVRREAQKVYLRHKFS